MYNTSSQQFQTILIQKPVCNALSNTLLQDFHASLLCTSLQHPSTALFYKTSIQNFSPTLLTKSTTLFPVLLPNISYNTSLQPSSPTPLYSRLQHFSVTRLYWLYNTLLQHLYMTLFSNTPLWHPSATLLYNTPLLLSSPALLYTTRPQHSPLQNCSSTPFSINHICPMLLYNIPKHFSTRLFSNTSLQHSSPTLLRNTFLHEFSTLPFGTILFGNTSLQRLYSTLLSKSSQTIN